MQVFVNREKNPSNLSTVDKLVLNKECDFMKPNYLNEIATSFTDNRTIPFHTGSTS